MKGSKAKTPELAKIVAEEPSGEQKAAGAAREDVDDRASGETASGEKTSEEDGAERDARRNVRTSAATQDSWGGGQIASLPPLAPRLGAEVEADEELSDPDEPKEEPERADSWPTSKPDEDDAESYINMKKFFRRSSDPINPNDKTIKFLMRFKSKKDNSLDLDVSHHSHSSFISQRSAASSYKGPASRTKSGKPVRGVMKKTTSAPLTANLPSKEPADDDTIPSVTSPDPNKPVKRVISFSKVEIREHERIAGDNPCVTSGVPLSIGWKSIQHDSIDIDEYENNKGPARDKVEMMVPSSVRRSMLREEFGVSIKEMNAAIKQVNITKRQRRHTVAQEHIEGWQEVLQSAKRKFKRKMRGTTTSKEEQALWEHAHKRALAQYLLKNGKDSLGNDPQKYGVGETGVGPEFVAKKEDPPPFLEIRFSQEH